MKRITGGSRLTVLALSSLACALVAMLVSVYIYGNAHPVAYAGAALPVAVFVFYPLWLGAALIGFLTAAYLLWNVDLARAIPFVAAVAVGAAAATANWFIFASPFTGLAAGLLAMQWSRSRSRWVFTSTASPAGPSVFREGLKGLAGHAGRGSK